MPMLAQQAQGALSFAFLGVLPVGLVTLMRLVLSPHPEERLSAALRGLAASSPAWSPPPLPRGAVFTAPPFPSSTFRLKDAFLVDPLFSPPDLFILRGI